MSLTQASIERILERDADSETRYIDLALSLALDGETLVTVGGRWDRATKCYIGPAASGRVTELSPAQADAGRWFAEWIHCYATDTWPADYVRPFVGIHDGGRGSGKSHLVMLECVAVALAHPGANIWAVSQTEEATRELRDVLEAKLLVEGWARWRADDGLYLFANGSKIVMRSAYKAQRLKAGDTHLVVLNEAQLMNGSAFVNVRPSIRASGGLVLLACNPPTVGGQWLRDLIEKTETGEATRVAYFRLDPQLNPHVNREVLSSTREEFDQDTYRREILGEYVPPGDRVIASWSDIHNRGEVPAHWQDVTQRFCSHWLGISADTIIGSDFYENPHCASAVIRLYRDPDEPDICRPVVIAEILAEHAEEDLAAQWAEHHALRALPGAPARDHLCDKAQTIVIADATGQKQAAGNHTSGASSWRILQRAGWRVIGPQYPRAPDSNPRFQDRYALQDKLCRSHLGVNRLLVTADCPWTAKAHREYPKTSYGPSRKNPYAHIVDAVSYATWRLFGYDDRAMRWNPDEYRALPARKPATPKDTSRRGSIDLAKKIKGM